MLILRGKQVPSWYPASYYIQPHYNTVPMVHINDLAAPTLRPNRQRFWQKARTMALADWERGGISFVVNEDQYGYACERITLDIRDTQDGTAGQAAFEYPPCEPKEVCSGCAWSHIDTEAFEQTWRSRDRSGLTKLIAHEIGHNLGFGHGGTGVMTIAHSGHVSDEELDALRSYWL